MPLNSRLCLDMKSLTSKQRPCSSKSGPESALEAQVMAAELHLLLRFQAFSGFLLLLHLELGCLACSKSPLRSLFGAEERAKDPNGRAISPARGHAGLPTWREEDLLALAELRAGWLRGYGLQVGVTKASEGHQSTGFPRFLWDI